MTAVKCWAEKTNFPAKFECLLPEYPNDISVLLQSFMVENTTERRDGGRGGGGGERCGGGGHIRFIRPPHPSIPFFSS